MLKRILLIITSLCLVWSAVAAAQEKSKLFQPGQEIYAANCAGCHRSNGEGLPKVFPALKGSAFVMGEASPVIQIILAGRKGNMSQMPSFQGSLTDQQIAAVVTFIRQNWGNQAEAVTSDMVAKNRK